MDETADLTDEQRRRWTFLMELDELQNKYAVVLEQANDARKRYSSAVERGVADRFLDTLMTDAASAAQESNAVGKRLQEMLARLDEALKSGPYAVAGDWANDG